LTLIGAVLNRSVLATSHQPRKCASMRAGSAGTAGEQLERTHRLAHGHATAVDDAAAGARAAFSSAVSSGK
jgi:hypothetical protein